MGFSKRIIQNDTRNSSFYSPMSQRCFVKTPQNSTLLSEWSLMAAKMIPTSKQNLLSILNSIPPDTSLNNSKPRCQFHSILSVMMNISHYSLKKLKQTKFYLTYNLIILVRSINSVQIIVKMDVSAIPSKLNSIFF